MCWKQECTLLNNLHLFVISNSQTLMLLSVKKKKLSNLKGTVRKGSEDVKALVTFFLNISKSMLLKIFSSDALIKLGKVSDKRRFSIICIILYADFNVAKVKLISCTHRCWSCCSSTTASYNTSYCSGFSVSCKCICVRGDNRYAVTRGLLQNCLVKPSKPYRLLNLTVSLLDLPCPNSLLL